jgi:FkbM family methyltransferase
VKAFRANLSDRPSVHLFETAIGSRDGSIQFFPNRDSQASSAMLLNGGNRPAHFCQLAPIDVPAIRLDRLLEGKILEAPILFKLDLQGYELEALRGATAILSRCEYVLVEAVFEDTYEGGPLFEELQNYLRGFGFRFMQPLAFLEGDGQIYQMDALFRKAAPDQRSPGPGVPHAYPVDRDS